MLWVLGAVVIGVGAAVLAFFGMCLWMAWNWPRH
jgi:hypothetical protein